MNKMYVTLLAAGLLFLLLACSEENELVMVGETPAIEEIKTADKWNPRLQQKYKVEVQVNDPQGPENIKGVTLMVLKEGSESVLFTDSLYDDGAFYNPEDGDVIAKDGIYSNRFLPAEIIFPVQPGSYIFRFTAEDLNGNQSKESEILVGFGENFTPTINSVIAPESLSVDLIPGFVQITVNDSDGLADIERAYFESRKKGSSQIRYEADLFNDGNPENGDAVAGDSIYSARLDTAFLVAKKGDYDLLFHVVDSFNEKNTEVPSVDMEIYNNPPQMSNLSMPESIALPSGSDVVLEPIEVRVSDPESLADIDSVYFYSVKEDSTLANAGRPIMLRDNGLPVDINDQDGISVGDLVAGDGIYTFTLVIRSTFIPLNDEDGKIKNTFKFYTRDKADNLIGPIVKKIEVFKPE